MATATVNIVELGKKVSVAVLYLVGTMLGIFNILAFKSDKGGIFYQDENQWWAAIAAAMFVAAWLIRNWKKL